MSKGQREHEWPVWLRQGWINDDPLSFWLLLLSVFLPLCSLLRSRFHFVIRQVRNLMLVLHNTRVKHENDFGAGL
jgi:hypothetical protein